MKKRMLKFGTKPDDNIKQNKKFTVVELFAGAGGLALGLEKAGFITKGLIENNKWAVETLKKNRKNWNIIAEDIRIVSKNGIKKYLKDNKPIDLLSGGYPCQTFSYAGNKQGLEDVRGTLFYDYAEILKQLKPKMFLAENVKGLVSHDKGRTLKIMLEVFKFVGYHVQYMVLNSLNYGVAQKRERIIIIGTRKDLYNNIKEIYKFPESLPYTLTLRDVLKNVPKSVSGTYSENKKKILELVPPGGCWRNLPEEIAKDYMGKSFYLGGGKTGIARRLSWNEPGLTVLCSPSQKQTERCHPDETRPFTVRENARIQSFPDDWIFEGPITAKYKQIGNAVPVEFAKHIGLSIKKYLIKLEENK